MYICPEPKGRFGLAQRRAQLHLGLTIAWELQGGDLPTGIHAREILIVIL
jgi:hypothetical protein